jgi:inosose dehydratase
MRDLGVSTTELGPAGYLGETPADVVARLRTFKLRLIGGFVPVPLHVDPELDLTEATDAMDILAAGGSDVVVLAARSADGSYDRKVVLSEDEWPVLLGNLDRLQRAARERGLLPTLHPHVGTAVEDRASVLRLLGSSDVLLCLDTGHLLIGGMQPAELLGTWADRVAHVHLKDVDAALAATVASGEVAYVDAVRAGLYTVLGQGDVDIAATVRALEGVGYRGYYVLEQDCALSAAPTAGTGPVDDVRASIAFLEALS